jgi:peptide-methionine (S)-S-oxide reductase
VLRTRVGYCGGTTDKPTYRRIGDHTEAVQVEFDPEVIAYRDLLDVFWSAHDPYRRTRSTQYRAVLWTHGEAQAKEAHASRAALAEDSGREVETPIEGAPRFWIAEDYHQKYGLRARSTLVDALFGADVDGGTLRESTLAARVNGWLAGHGTPEEIARQIEGFDLGEKARKALGEALGKRAPPACH